VTFTPNYWLNEEKTLEYINKVILPFIQAKCEELKLQPALVEFEGQLTDFVHSLLDTNKVAKVPPNCIDCLQPTNLAVNRSAKEILHRKFVLGILIKLNRN